MKYSIVEGIPLKGKTPTQCGSKTQGLRYFTHLKCQKRIGDDVGDLKYLLTKKIKNDQPDTFYPTYYARI
jgi:hypothetical protein